MVLFLKHNNDIKFWKYYFSKKTKMKHILFPLFSIFFVFTTAQTSNIKIYSENQEPFSIKINGQKVSSIDDNTHDISGMKQGVDYEVFIDYTMPNTSDVRTSINIMKNGH